MSEPEPGRRGPPRWIAVVALVALVALVRYCGSGGEPEAGVVKGRVVHGDGGPAPGALVEAIFEVEGTNIPLQIRAGPLGADGTFDLQGAPARWKNLKLLGSRFPLVSEMDLGNAPGPLDITIRLPATFVVGGLVVASEMGQPLANMDVKFGHRTTRTNSLGRFAFRDLPAALLKDALPSLQVSGSGRKTTRRELAGGGERLDDLLLRVEQGP